MGTKLHVANLNVDVTDEEIHTLFSTVGPVASASISKDAKTGASRGSASVEMSTEEGAQSALEVLNGHVLNGQKIHVGEVRLPTANGKPAHKAVARKLTAQARSRKRTARPS